MKTKWRLYIIITLIIILAGGLLIAKGTDAVSQAESKKQGILNTEPNTEGFYVDLYIPESQINQLQADQKVNVRFPYLENLLVKEGVVTSIAPLLNSPICV